MSHLNKTDFQHEVEYEYVVEEANKLAKLLTLEELTKLVKNETKVYNIYKEALAIKKDNNIMITLEQFTEVNDQELNCIFAETGADRELDFDRELAIEKLYENTEYVQLIRTPRDLERNEKRQKKYNMDFEIEELTSIGTPYDEAVEYVEWKHQ